MTLTIEQQALNNLTERVRALESRIIVHYATGITHNSNNSMPLTRGMCACGFWTEETSILQAHIQTQGAVR